MGSVVKFPAGAKPASASAAAPSTMDELEALLFQCSMLVDPFSREVRDLYRTATGDAHTDPESVHEWLFFEQRESVALIPVLAGIALRTGRISASAHAEVLDEMADLLRQAGECA